MSWSLYLLKVAAVQGLMLAFYYLLFDRLALGHFKRAYLLIALALSFLVPVIPVVTVFIEDASLPNVMSQSTTYRVDGREPTDTSSGGAAWSAIALTVALLRVVYLVGVCYGIIRLISFFRTFRMQIQAGTQHWVDGIQLVVLPYAVPSHSFLRWVFCAENIQPSRAVLVHEFTHVRQLHSIDRLLIAVLKIAWWFNPLIWLYERAIKNNHELLADRSVMRAGFDPYAYQRELFHQLQLQSEDYTLVSGSSFHLTKKRFIMMSTQAPPLRRVLARCLLLICGVALTILAMGGKVYAQHTGQTDSVVNTDQVEDTTVPRTSKQPPYYATSLSAPDIKDAFSLTGDGEGGYSFTLCVPPETSMTEWQSPKYQVYVNRQRMNADQLSGYNGREFAHYYVSPEPGEVTRVDIYTEAQAWRELRRDEGPALPPPPVTSPLGIVDTVAPPPIDLTQVEPRAPSDAQLMEWTGSTAYGMWVNGRAMPADQVASYPAGTFVHYQLSKLMPGAVNYGKQKYQVDLWTAPQFKREFREEGGALRPNIPPPPPPLLKKVNTPPRHHPGFAHRPPPVGYRLPVPEWL